MTELEAVRKVFKADVYATKTTGIEIADIGNNTTCTMNIDARHLNARGAVMGGAIFTLADFALAVVSYSSHNPCVTISSSIHYFNAPKGTQLIAKAIPLKIGRKISFYRIDITDNLDTCVASVECSGCRVEK